MNEQNLEIIELLEKTSADTKVISATISMLKVCHSYNFTKGKRALYFTVIIDTKKDSVLFDTVIKKECVIEYSSMEGRVVKHFYLPFRKSIFSYFKF